MNPDELVLGGVVIPRGSDFAFNYAGARYNDRLRDWSHLAGSQAEWTSLPQGERNLITSRLRWLVQNNEYAGALANTFVTHIGNSTLRSKSGNTEYDNAKENLWLDYSDACEISDLSLEEVEDIIYTELLVAGEVYVLKLQNGQIQLVPSEFCFSGSQPLDNEIQGIIYNSALAPIAYRFGHRDAKGNVVVGENPVPAAQVLHIYRRQRVEQRRGVPWLASAVNVLMDIQEITTAKVASVKVQSFLAAAVTKTPGNSDPIILRDLPSSSSPNRPNRYKTLKSATLMYLEPGESINTIGPNFQSSDFDAFLLSRLRAAGATIGLPIELFIEGYRDSNYSSARATNLAWGKKVRKTRRLMERRFLKPIQMWKSERARADGVFSIDTIKLDGQTDFGWPAIPVIDEAKETEANVKKLAAGLTTYSAVYAEQNLFWEDEFKQRAREAKFTIDLAATEGVSPEAIMPGLGANKGATEMPEPPPELTSLPDPNSGTPVPAAA